VVDNAVDPSILMINNYNIYDVMNNHNNNVIKFQKLLCVTYFGAKNEKDIITVYVDKSRNFKGKCNGIY
jgi:hypothetical protein